MHLDAIDFGNEEISIKLTNKQLSATVNFEDLGIAR
jgi:hypothetical protein